MQYLAVVMIYCSVTAAPLDFRGLCIASTLFTLSYRVIPGELNLELLIMHFLFFFLLWLFMRKVKLQNETVSFLCHISQSCTQLKTEDQWRFCCSRDLYVNVFGVGLSSLEQLHRKQIGLSCFLWLGRQVPPLQEGPYPSQTVTSESLRARALHYLWKSKQG